MTRAKLDKVREQLRHLAGRLQHDAWAVQDRLSGSSGGQADGGLSNTPMHLADVGTDEWNHELNSAVLENEQSVGLQRPSALVKRAPLPDNLVKRQFRVRVRFLLRDLRGFYERHSLPIPEGIVD